MNRAYSIACALILTVAFVSGCQFQTDREKYKIGAWEDIREPDGLFPEIVDQRSYAASQVVYYFQAARERMLDDPSITLSTMAYFEWLANDLRTDNQVPPESLRELLDARDTLRELVNISPDASTSDVVNQYFATSKFLELSSRFNKSYPEEVIARRRFLLLAKGQINRLSRQVREARKTGKVADMGVRK